MNPQALVKKKKKKKRLRGVCCLVSLEFHTHLEIAEIVFLLQLAGSDCTHRTTRLVSLVNCLHL